MEGAYRRRGRSADALERYLDGAGDDYHELLLTLFSHRTEGVGVASAERWSGLLDRARHRGAFLGVDPGAFPRDFASFGWFHLELSALARMGPPTPLTLEKLDAFLDERPCVLVEPRVTWI